VKNKRVSSKDVARESGVSQATVSYVLNNNPNVKIRPETRQNVLDTAKRLNYHVNYIARNMRLRKSTSIGIVTNTEMASHIFIRTLEGIKDSLIDRNYSLTICFGTPEDISDAEYIKYYYSNLIDGIIFVFCHLSQKDIEYLEENSIPYVMINASPTQEENFHIKTDFSVAMNEAIAGLKSSGIEDIGFLGHSAGLDGSVRYEAFLEAVVKNQISLDNIRAFKTRYNEKYLDDDIEDVLQGVKHPQAMICETINAGFYFLRYVHRHNIQIPQDMSIITIGTTMFSERCYPALSAVEAPLYNMGRRGVDLLFQIMEDDSKTLSDSIVLEWKFVKRESSI